ncbi:RNA 2',3'-cyclic phosphodiesterase [Oxalobacteraceae bacterium]|nr:RNA 2',3'-cyclic phosphodiesterase [Oxalobacteraceae bacterium]
MTGTVAAHRLFFALWPDPATRAALARLQSLVPGRAVPAANLHLTLAFLGRQPADLLPVLDALPDSLDFAPLVLAIDQLGYFAGPRIAWAGMREPPAALMDLQGRLMARLAEAGIAAADTHGVFRPHVTLARHAPPLDRGGTVASFAPLPWRANQLALVESGAPDGLYRVRSVICLD